MLHEVAESSSLSWRLPLNLQQTDQPLLGSQWVASCSPSLSPSFLKIHKVPIYKVTPEVNSNAISNVQQALLLTVNSAPRHGHICAHLNVCRLLPSLTEWTEIRAVTASAGWRAKESTSPFNRKAKGIPHLSQEARSLFSYWRVNSTVSKIIRNGFFWAIDSLALPSSHRFPYMPTQTAKCLKNKRKCHWIEFHTRFGSWQLIWSYAQVNRREP